MIGRIRPFILISAGTRRIFLALLIVGLLTVALLPRQAQKVLQSVGQPIADLIAIPMGFLASGDRGVRDIWNRYIALQGVHDQNLQFQQQIEQLQGELNQLREKAQASDRLAAILDFQTTTPMKTIAAKVIGPNASLWYRALVLDKGTNDGVENEMGVITPAGVVGQVIKVASSTSLVLLLTDSNVAVTGLVQRTRDEGIIQGSAQGYVRMKYIPPLSPVKAGDWIVTSGLTGGFPRGLLIGSVQQVQEGEGDLFQSALVQPIVDFTKLEEVLIVLAAQPQEDFDLVGESLPFPNLDEVDQ
jgi:rod shape-determining protein MreC